ncbi:hypothetical protein [Rhodococcus sp. Eu-32]|uniref:hypothetical protein n=1 Tax=Rhodococcus sp. Eu-32 TaxID=1017319 RepID=UPI001FB2A134|nr:hypothetical protein [Rhodococcus sp. Eu-32]
METIADAQDSLGAAEVLAFVSRLQQRLDLPDAAAGVDLISALETVKSAASAVQATATVSVATTIETTRKESGKPKSQ